MSFFRNDMVANAVVPWRPVLRCAAPQSACCRTVLPHGAALCVSSQSRIIATPCLHATKPPRRRRATKPPYHEAAVPPQPPRRTAVVQTCGRAAVAPYHYTAASPCGRLRHYRLRANVCFSLCPSLRIAVSWQPPFFV